MYIPRFLETEVEKANKSFKIIYLGGPRQVGKTTLLKNLATKSGFNYVTLDDIELRNQAISEPKLFLKNFAKPLLIDEIQYAPELVPYLKMAVDQDPEPGQYWITGSQHFSIIKNLQESLAGRVAILSLNTLSMAESSLRKKSKNAFLPTKTDLSQNIDISGSESIFKQIIRGGFPALVADPSMDSDLFFSSYIQTYLEKDLVNLFGIQNVGRFYKFLQLCADRTGQMLNYSDLARDCDISVQTAKDWIFILEGTMQIYLLKPYSNNFSKRLIKSPKLYFLDTGLATYLSGWRKFESLENSVYSGRLFETFAISEIIKSYLFRGKTPPLSYLRDKEGHEIDLIIESENQIYPIEIKSSSKFQFDFIKNIVFLKNRIENIDQSAVILNNFKSYEVKESISVISIWDID